MNYAPVYVTDIIGEVISAADAVLFPLLGKHINYTYGRSVQVLRKLQDLTESVKVADRASKYPLIALIQDFPERRGGEYYGTVTFPRIIIATLTNSNDDPPKRYDQTFKPILYPIYYEFIRQLSRHKEIVGSEDPNTIIHTKWDRPGTQQAGGNFNDYLDAIDITDLQLTFKQNCLTT